MVLEQRSLFSHVFVVQEHEAQHVVLSRAGLHKAFEWRALGVVDRQEGLVAHVFQIENEVEGETSGDFTHPNYDKF